MASNIFTTIKKIINRVVDVVLQGNLDRVRILGEFNRVFEYAFLTSEINRKCSVTTSPGKPGFGHALSTIYPRSGFKITILNDDYLTDTDLFEISGYVLESPSFVRKLMAVGYDTLIVKGENSTVGLQIPLRKFGNIDDYMIQ
ncbi:hypothetical protein GCM10023314_01550 [Algibacter agarivorans]|uniref:Uncharacterized protein n=1 Tax=Algibacter agarivorans TaxID=1109741 RepID=A0ABP9GC77_9FLAO